MKEALGPVYNKMGVAHYEMGNYTEAKNFFRESLKSLNETGNRKEASMTMNNLGNLLLLTGDVPEPGYIPVNDIVPYGEFTRTAMPLLDFLAHQGVEEFESVTFTSSDGGVVTVARENLGEGSLLLPHTDGEIRAKVAVTGEMEKNGIKSGDMNIDKVKGEVKYAWMNSQAVGDQPNQ